MSANDGGPAFPTVDANRDEDYGTRGMTLRDYYIAHAPAQEIEAITPDTIEACAAFIGIEAKDYKGGVHYIKCLAKSRVIWADAMLEARK